MQVLGWLQGRTQVHIPGCTWHRVEDFFSLLYLCDTLRLDGKKCIFNLWDTRSSSFWAKDLKICHKIVLASRQDPKCILLLNLFFAIMSVCLRRLGPSQELLWCVFDVGAASRSTALLLSLATLATQSFSQEHKNTHMEGTHTHTHTSPWRNQLCFVLPVKHTYATSFLLSPLGLVFYYSMQSL